MISILTSARILGTAIALVIFLWHLFRCKAQSSSTTRRVHFGPILLRFLHWVSASDRFFWFAILTKAARDFPKAVLQTSKRMQIGYYFCTKKFDTDLSLPLPLYGTFNAFLGAVRRGGHYDTLPSTVHGVCSAPDGGIHGEIQRTCFNAEETRISPLIPLILNLTLNLQNWAILSKYFQNFGVFLCDPFFATTLSLHSLAFFLSVFFCFRCVFTAEVWLIF